MEMGFLFELATFLTLFILAFQYSWNHFIMVWYEGRLRKKNLREDEIANKIRKVTRMLAIPIMFLLVLTVILALVDLTWR